MVGMGSALSVLKEEVQKAQEDLNRIESFGEPLPEMIDSTNLLRTNEYLIKVDAKKSDLLHAYKQYVAHLEQIVSSLLSIQADMKEIIRAEAALLGSEPDKPRKTTKKAKKPRK